MTKITDVPLNAKGVIVPRANIGPNRGSADGRYLDPVSGLTVNFDSERYQTRLAREGGRALAYNKDFGQRKGAVELYNVPNVPLSDCTTFLSKPAPQSWYKMFLYSTGMEKSETGTYTNLPSTLIPVEPSIKSR